MFWMQSWKLLHCKSTNFTIFWYGMGYGMGELIKIWINVKKIGKNL